MRHEGQMATISRANACGSIIGAVWIARIRFVAVFHHNIVLFFGVWKLEFSFAMRYPNAQSAAGKVAQHDGGIFLNSYI